MKTIPFVFLCLFILPPFLFAREDVHKYLFEPMNSVDSALETARKLDVPPKEYLVSVTTAESNKSSDQLRGIGFSFQPAGGTIGTFDEDRARLNLSNVTAGSNNRSTQMIRVMTGSTASIFIGQQVPIVTNQLLQTPAMMDAGQRLVIRAISPSGQDGVLLGLSTESSQIVPSGTSLPAKRQFVTEATVRARFGMPVTVALHGTSSGGNTNSVGGNGVIHFEENRRLGSRNFALGDITWRKQGSYGVQRRRRRGGSSIIVTLVVREAP